MNNKPPPRAPSQRPRRAAPDHDAAVELAIAALAFIAGAAVELQRFLALSGIDPGAIRAAAAEPGFLEGVLGYIAGNERTLVSFATAAGVAPEAVEEARLVLARAADAEGKPP